MPAAAEAQLLVGHVQVAGQLARRALHRVAQPHDLQPGGPQRQQRQRRHGVGIVHDQRAGAQALHVAQDVQPGRTGAQHLEDAARADGVADALVHAVLERDVVIVAHVAQPGNLDGLMT